MKILFIGPNNGTSKHNYLSIKNLNKNTDFLNTDYFDKNKIFKFFLWHTNLKIFNHQINLFYKNNVKKDYDIIFFNNVPEITKKSILEIKKKTKKIFFFCGDNPFTNRDKFRWKNFKEIIPFIDLIIFHIEGRKKYIKKFNIKKYLITVPPYYKEVHFNNVRKIKKKEVVFIGTWFPERGKFFYELKKKGLNFDIYGNKWNKDKKYYKYLKENIKKALNYKETAKIISKYKINIGLLSKGNDDNITRRCIEIPATGSLLCCERTKFLKLILKENKEAIYFSSADECYKKCVYLLKNENRIKNISINGNIKVRKKLNLEAKNIFKKILNFNLIKSKKKLIIRY